MIIETSSNQFFQVRESVLPSLSHVWLGVEVKLVKGMWVPKAKAREVAVRKEASRIINYREGAA